MKKYGIYGLVAVCSLFLLSLESFNAGPAAGEPAVQSIRYKLEAIQQMLDQIPPAWGKTLPVEDRFVLVLNDEAVLDKETGLVWERSPSLGSPAPVWINAIDHCYNLELGGRKGWHLPTIEQLSSLADTSAEGDVKLPTGHPFDTDCATGGCVTPSIYWSATTVAEDPAWAWGMSFRTGIVGRNVKANDHRAWCVRGGQSYDAW